jgi:saccharopine dehydrogenase-like protein
MPRPAFHPAPAPITTAVRASGDVHWVGAGLSNGVGLSVVAGLAGRITLWARTPARGERLLAAQGLGERVEVRNFDLADLTAAVAPGDVIVSMAPATEHAALLDIAQNRQAHFVCTSYTSAQIEELAAKSAERGLVVVTETGLDPGIDHLFAHDLVEAARAEIGDGPATARFTSYCGGVPAVPNAFRYRFSWAPRGVLGALLNPATFVAAGRTQVVARPWEATRAIELRGETFEVYPNRDSVPFIAQYGLPAGWQIEEFVRGTLRLDGWRQAWAEIFDLLPTADDRQLDALAADLATRYPATETDTDRVVLAVALELRGADGNTWHGERLLDLIGDEHGSAMGRCVSLPLAGAVADILTGRTPPGLIRAAPDLTAARRQLTFLEQQGLSIST